jgi:surface polysaccharide O-acyltransferase-like enzyme
MENAKRFFEISMMRVMAMLMIIAFHSMCFYNGKWTKFDAIRIPFWTNASEFLDVVDLNMFVFISGYLYGYLYIYRNKYRHPSEVIRNKAVRLLIPYFFWGIPMAIVWPWNTMSSLLYGVGHLWFLLMLFGVFTLTVILQLLNAQRIKFTFKIGLFLIVVAYLGMYVFMKYVNPRDFLCTNRILYYFQAFMIGYVCAKLQVGWLMPGWSFVLLPLGIAILLLLVCVRLPIPYHMWLLAKSLCAYTICVSLLVILSKVPVTGKFRDVVIEIERLSMGIYIFNQMMMDLVFTTPMLHRFFEAHWQVGPFILFLIGFLPPLMLSYIFNKYKWLSWTIG